MLFFPGKDCHKTTLLLIMQGTGAVAPPLSHVFVSFTLPLISKVTLATGALQ